MAEVGDLLRDREVGGLTLFIGLQIVGLAVLGLAIVSFVADVDVAWIALVAVAGVAVLGVLMRMVRRRRHMAVAGHLAILVSFVVTGLIPFAEWQGVGVDAYAAAYLVKTGFSVGLVLVALTGLTLQPHYPATATALAVVFELVLLWLALDDPRTVLAAAATWQEHIMGPALHLGRVANQMAFTVATGATVTLATWIARRTVLSGVRLEKANGQLRRYFSPDTAERVATAEAEFLRPGGTVRPVAILVSDLAGFTRLTASLGPDETLRLLADYQKRMTQAIFANGGSVDKFIGDGILATFGALGDTAGSCARAAAAARDMVAALDAWNVERRAAGEVDIAHRIGLHAGPAMVGNVGTEDRLEFTVVGDVVNLASRIEQACKTTADTVLLSAAIRAECPDVATVSRGAHALRGVEEPYELFALCDMKLTEVPGA